MRITVFGASGKVGIRVVELALKRGHHVTAFVHKHDPFQGTQNLIVIKGDIRNPQDVEKALVGSEAVISTLGSWHTKSKDVLSAAMGVIIPEMKVLSIRRIITLTGSDAIAPGETLKGVHKLFHMLIRLGAGKILHDGERHIQMLSDSGLDWTVLRSPAMTNIGSKKYHLGLQPISPLATIRRQAVAVALVDQLMRKKAIAKAPIISRA